MFDESKHPRNKSGKFTDGNNDSKKAQYDNLPDANKLVDNYEKRFGEIQPSENKKKKTEEEFFGEEFKGVKGTDAVEKLLKEKRGHVKNAFERPEIGGIDLVWGDETGGLAHTILRRDKILARGTGTISGIDMVRKIPQIMEEGAFDVDTLGRPGFEYDGCRVAVRPTYDGKKLNWIVSAMEIFK